MKDETLRPKPLPENARILIVKTHAIGDLLLTTPAIRDLRAAYPSAHLTLLVGTVAAPAIRGNPHLDEILEIDDRIFLRRRWLGILRLLLRVRRERFDAAVIFHPLPIVHLFTLLAGIPLRYGLTTDRGSRFLTAGFPEDLGKGRYYAENFQHVAALAGARPGSSALEVHPDAADEREARKLLASAGVDIDAGYLLVAPGGGRNSKEDVAAKRWPKEYFAELLGRLRRERPTLTIVLCGASGDKAETDFIAGRVSGVADLTGKTSLPQLFCLVRMAKAIVCNDSAILHVGIAVRTPVIAPFGPTYLARFIPEPLRGDCVQSGIACSPCFVGGMFPGCSIGFQCMKDIRPESLVPPLDRALGSLGRGESATAV